MKNETLELLKKSSPLLVASLDGDDLPYLLEQARSERADVVEIRLDIWGSFFREEMLEKMARFKQKVGIPMLVSFRGGHPFPAWWQPAHWRALGYASLIDVEWDPEYPWHEIVRNAKKLNLGLVISHHDYQATPSEIYLVKIARAAYAKYVPRIGREPAPMIADFPAEIAAGRVVVIETAGAVAGYLVAWPEPDAYFVDNVAVDPARQGDGLGRRLMDHAAGEARRRSLPAVRLYTNVAMTENLSMYTHLGFVETHRATEHGFHRIYMRWDLGGGG